MPPWAPEALEKATPAARAAIQRHLEEARQRFIAERDARLATLPAAGDIGATQVVAEQPSEPLHISENPTSPAAKSNESSRPSSDDGHTTSQEHSVLNAIPAQEEYATSTLSETSIVLSPTCDISSDVPKTGSNSEKAAAEPVTAATAAPSLESRRSHMTAADTEQVPNPPVYTSTSLSDFDSDVDSYHTAEEKDILDDDIPAPPPLTDESLCTQQWRPELVVDGCNQKGVDQFASESHSNGRHSKDNGDSAFHPLQGSLVSPSHSHVPFGNPEDDTQLQPQTTYNEVSSSNRAAQSGKEADIPLRVRDTSQYRSTNYSYSNNMPSKTTSTSPPHVPHSNSLDHMSSGSLHVPTINGLVESFDSKPPTNVPKPLLQTDNLDMTMSDNLEEIVLSRRSRRHKRRPSLPLLDDFNASPSPLSSKRYSPPFRTDEHDNTFAEDEIVNDVVHCSDCQAWRSRVKHLEAKVESLTSTLAAREMDIATLRARIGDDGRHVPKSEARLMQECESLRVTAEFLVSHCKPLF